MTVTSRKIAARPPERECAAPSLLAAPASLQDAFDQMTDDERASLRAFAERGELPKADLRNFAWMAGVLCILAAGERGADVPSAARRVRGFLESATRARLAGLTLQQLAAAALGLE